MKNPDILAKKLGIRFIDTGLLYQALTHRSFLNESRSWPYGQNERLEFLGDAVLELAVTDHLFTTYPDRQEGDLTSLRVALVNADTLAKVAQELGFAEYIFMSTGQKKDSGRAWKHILTGALEALIGALYVDQGLEKARALVKATLLVHIDDLIEAEAHKDPKSVFQDFAQERYQVTPTYQVLSKKGPDHDTHFECGVFIKEKCVGKGQGSSKADAEKEAAAEALRLLKVTARR